MKNDMLEYYEEHQISPVKQNIDNIEIHYTRRRKLYLQCGIPIITFKNAEILEIGPGGGYNTLAFFHWGSRQVDLVEANHKGIEEMQELFTEKNIAKDRYKIFPCMIENYQTDKKYDIIIAEGFLPLVYNQQEIIDKLKKLVNENGIIVITCMDYAGLFIEIMKRLAGITVTADIPEYERKVEYLAGLFAPQLELLKGVSRSPKEWVQDQILCPAIMNGNQLTMLQAMNYFGEEFDVLGSSPRMFTDYSWYKDTEYNNKKNYKEQFNTKRMSLLMANMPEVIVPAEQTELLVKGFENIAGLEAEYEKTLDIEKIADIIKEMDLMEDMIQKNFNKEFIEVFYEIKEMLAHIQKGISINMENYFHFFSAFGRTQQYISFIKK